MKIVNDFPPNIDKIRKHLNPGPFTVFTYGDTIYNPHGGNMDECLLAHEATHSVQQEKMGVEKWWTEYIVDMDFRLSQEVEAYQNQWTHAKKEFNRAYRKFLLPNIAKDLSSEMYGSMVTLEEAKKLIQSE